MLSTSVVSLWLSHDDAVVPAAGAGRNTDADIEERLARRLDEDSRQAWIVSLFHNGVN